MDPGGDLPIRLLGLQLKDDVDAADDQDIVLQLNLADRLRHQSLIRSVYVTRLQRASKGSGKSTGSRSNNVVEGCGVRFEHRPGHLVVFGDRSVDAEDHGRGLRGEIRSAQGSFTRSIRTSER